MGLKALGLLVGLLALAANKGPELPPEVPGPMPDGGSDTRQPVAVYPGPWWPWEDDE